MIREVRRYYYYEEEEGEKVESVRTPERNEYLMTNDSPGNEEPAQSRTSIGKKTVMPRGEEVT